MRHTLFLTVIIFLCGFICQPVAAAPLCEPKYDPIKNIVVSCGSGNAGCNELGRAVLDGDGKSIIVCLYANDGTEKRWVNATYGPSSAFFVHISAGILSSLIPPEKCTDPYAPGGLKPCNKGCYAFCQSTLHYPNGGLLSDWIFPAPPPALPAVPASKPVKGKVGGKVRGPAVDSGESLGARAPGSSAEPAITPSAPAYPTAGCTCYR